MTITVELEGMEDLSFTELWPRHERVGFNGEAWCGGSLIVTVTRPFTVEEDHIFLWVMKQDACQLIGVHHLPDGRDIILFERMFVLQSKVDAIQEHQEHLQKLLDRLTGSGVLRRP